MTSPDPHSPDTPRTVPLEWFDHRGVRAGQRDAAADDVGLRFACTQCGACCSGSPGFVLFSPDEEAALAAHTGLSVQAFRAAYVHDTQVGPSLKEVPGPAGHDCVFLDRRTIPGKAVCSVYHLRPAQCRTWPFWESTLSSEHAWRRTAQGCPGVDRGPRVTPPDEIRRQRAVVRV
jgi:hypothetical protein